MWSCGSCAFCFQPALLVERFYSSVNVLFAFVSEAFDGSDFFEYVIACQKFPLWVENQKYDKI